MSCTCQICGNTYKVDVSVNDNLWKKIKPEGNKDNAGLICGPCIMKRIEKIDEYDAYFLKNIEEFEKDINNIISNVDRNVLKEYKGKVYKHLPDFKSIIDKLSELYASDFEYYYCVWDNKVFEIVLGCIRFPSNVTVDEIKNSEWYSCQFVDNGKNYYHKNYFTKNNVAGCFGTYFST